MPPNIQALRSQLRELRAGVNLRIEVMGLALEHARDRFFEIEDRITNQRITTLVTGVGIVDQLLWVALGGVGGLLASVVAERMLARMLKNHLLYVDTYVRVYDAQISEKARQFLKIPKDSFPIDQIRVKEFLNENSMAGRLYRLTPDFVGSRLDEMIQTGANPTSLMGWGNTTSAADDLLEIRAWLLANKTANEIEFDDLEQQLSRKPTQEELEKLAGKVDVITRSINRSEASSDRPRVQELAIREAKPLSDLFLFMIVSKKYGPPERYAVVKTGSASTQLQIIDGKEVGIPLFVHSYKEGGKVILETLIKEVNQLAVYPPRSYYVIATEREPVKEEIKKERWVQQSIIRKAVITMLIDFNRLRLDLIRSPIPAKDLGYGN